MVFSSTTFLLYFLPVVLTAYYLLFLPVQFGWHAGFWRRASNLLLLVVSLFFYFWGENWLIWILLTSMLTDYLCALWIAGGFRRGAISCLPPDVPRTATQKLALLVSIVGNLAFLGYFKYFNFGLDTYNDLVSSMHAPSLAWRDVARVTLPLGISFYTFQSMSYTIDVYRGQVAATRNLIDFACCITAFPHLVAGPIIRYRDLATQAVARTLSADQIVSGIHRFVTGLGKKMLVANTVAVAADRIFALPTSELTCGVAWLGAFAYTLQIYFDFSGYSDMAIGLGRMLGFEFVENFNYPYIACSVQDFWRRWHISLSTWLRDYVYIPLGGGRVSLPRVYFNLLLVFFLCGLWHGASWSFVLWGLYHGTLLVVERTGLVNFGARTAPLLGRAYTLVAVMAGWILFRSESIEQTRYYLAALLGFGSGSGRIYSFASFATIDVKIAIAAGALLATPLVPAILGWLERHWISSSGPIDAILAAAGSLVKTAWVFGILLACCALQAAGSHNPFIYFRF